MRTTVGEGKAERVGKGGMAVAASRGGLQPGENEKPDGSPCLEGTETGLPTAFQSPPGAGPAPGRPSSDTMRQCKPSRNGIIFGLANGIFQRASKHAKLGARLPAEFLKNFGLRNTQC